MGYTHYWTQTRDFTPEEMGDICASIRRIIDEAGDKNFDGGFYPNQPVTICGGNGDAGTGPDLTKKYISFNGEGDLSRETFYFDAERKLESWQRPEMLGWSFCKTARKPYDVVVTACLTFLQADYGFEVSSDGDVDEWEPGVALAEKALGKAFANPLIVEKLMS